MLHAEGVHWCFTEVQLEGKKRMEADAFLRGCQIMQEQILRDHKE